MREKIKKIRVLFKAFLDLVLPPVCYICGAACSSDYGLCDACMDKIKYILPPYCVRCGKQIIDGKKDVCKECAADKKPHIERAWSCCCYEGTIRESIHLFKYKGYLGLVDVFKDIMIDFMVKNEIDKKVDVIVPVPVHRAKKREKTFNHSELLAGEISKRFDIPLDMGNLKKVKWTRPQNELDKHGRLRNVRDTFVVVEREKFCGKKILLIDDVYTTGATVNECARILKAADADKVFSLSLSRGV